MTWPRGLREFAVGITVLLTAGSAQAQQPPPCNAAPFLANTGWRGSVTISGTGIGTVQDSMGGTFTYNVKQSIQLTPNVNLSASQQNIFQGAENASINVNDTYTYTPPPSPGTPAVTRTDLITAFGNSSMGDLNGGANFGIISIGDCGYALGVDNAFTPFTFTTNGSSSQGRGMWGPPSAASGNMLVPPITSSTSQLLVPFPTSGLELTGSIQFHAQPFDVPGYPDPLDVPDVVWIISWDLIPIPRALDLILTIPNYGTWRPTAGQDEKTFGKLGVGDGAPANLLAITGQLVFKDTQQPADFGPNQVVFTLTQFSSQPGVSMNWPPKSQVLSNPSPPDLSFMDLSGLGGGAFNTGFAYNSNGTQATYAPSSTAANPPVTVNLLPYDWGGWAVLTVTAYVTGRDSVSGHFATDPATAIPLPKRQPNSYIADAWKTQHNVPLSTADADDSEEAPVSRAGCTGDGLTLYEEYRGFMENGKHIEGDPHNKDFFIENLIGSDAEPGIFLFTALTGLTIHKDIQRNETLIDHPNGSLGSILVNFNHLENDPTHLTDQHGVTIVTAIDKPGSTRGEFLNGGLTILTVPDVHGAPKITDGIAMQDREIEIAPPLTLDPANTHNRSITVTDAFLQYDVGIAHELLHSVGVDHHGEVDPGEQKMVFFPPNVPQNPSDQPTFQLNSQNIHLLSESGVDLAAKFWNNIKLSVAFCNVVSQTPAIWPNFIIDNCRGFQQAIAPVVVSYPWVGIQHGQHSGNDQCVMRYWFAAIYPSLKDGSTYYDVKSGTENVGSSLCSTRDGTGVNAPSHQPQSRYGPAALEADPSSIGRGSCEKWICVSDAYPLVGDKLSTQQ